MIIWTLSFLICLNRNHLLLITIFLLFFIILALTLLIIVLSYASLELTMLFFGFISFFLLLPFLVSFFILLVFVFRVLPFFFFLLISIVFQVDSFLPVISIFQTLQYLVTLWVRYDRTKSHKSNISLKFQLRFLAHRAMGSLCFSLFQSWVAFILWFNWVEIYYFLIRICDFTWRIYFISVVDRLPLYKLTRIFDILGLL